MAESGMRWSKRRMRGDGRLSKQEEQRRALGPLLALVCTDRGQHGAKTISEVWDDGDGYVMTRMAEDWAPPYRIDDDVSTVYRFNCPMCPRDLQYRPDRWWPIFEGAVKSGMSLLDLSYME